MSDLSGSSAQWWDIIQNTAMDAYKKWMGSTPLQRLRMKVTPPAIAQGWPRTEQRGVTMLLAATPEVVRRELISARKLTCVEILFALLCRFQPGGSHERQKLLREITVNDLNPNANIVDFVNTLRLWRRNLGRAAELRIQLPDPLVLVGLLTSWADHLGKLGGAQLVYRVASLRQHLGLDTVPTDANVMEFAEALHAEAEQLALASSSTWSSSSTSPSHEKPKKEQKEQIKAAALKAGNESPNSGEKRCRFWGSSVGCKRGDQCKFIHSWEGIERRGRCWNCSAENHMKPECPYPKSAEQGEKHGEKHGEKYGDRHEKRISKVKGTPKGPGGKGSGKESPKGGSPSAQPAGNTGDANASGSASPTSPVEGPKAKIVEETGSFSTAAAQAVNDITGLVKSLKSLKAVHLRYVASGGSLVDEDQPVALVDGGATHALRRGTAAELEGAEPVVVELAHGSTTLFRKRNCSTLLSRDEVEPIIPVRLLIDHGYQMSWNASGCIIKHPQWGQIQVWRRQGCPVMERKAALSLLRDLEETERETKVDDETVAWWKKRYPNVPDEVWNYMKGQGKTWNDCGQGLPWNRHRRRQLENSRGIILHVFSGDSNSSKKWEKLKTLGYEVITLDIASGKNEDLHSPAIWAYLTTLAKSGKLKILLGGPPCRSFSRLRHNPPGPRPVRGRNQDRWGLPNLKNSEIEMVLGDSALVLKMFGLFDMMNESNTSDDYLGFLLEHPMDVADYLDGEETEVVPSIWEWPELKAFQEKYGMSLVKFDQGRTGHVRRKPTCLMTNLPKMNELNGLFLTDQKRKDLPLPSDLKVRMKTTSSWAAWSPGLVEAVKESITMIVNTEVKLKKMSMDDWRQHVAQNHVPYRRDCRVCMWRRWVKTLLTDVGNTMAVAKLATWWVSTSLVLLWRPMTWELAWRRSTRSLPQFQFQWAWMRTEKMKNPRGKSPKRMMLKMVWMMVQKVPKTPNQNMENPRVNLMKKKKPWKKNFLGMNFRGSLVPGELVAPCHLSTPWKTSMNLLWLMRLTWRLPLAMERTHGTLATIAWPKNSTSTGETLRTKLRSRSLCRTWPSWSPLRADLPKMFFQLWIASWPSTRCSVCPWCGYIAIVPRSFSQSLSELGLLPSRSGRLLRLEMIRPATAGLKVNCTNGSGDCAWLSRWLLHQSKNGRLWADMSMRRGFACSLPGSVFRCRKCWTTMKRL